MPIEAKKLVEKKAVGDNVSLSLSLLLGILLLAKFCTNGVSLGDTTVLSSCTRILLEYFFPPIIESLRHIKYFCPTMKSFRFFPFLAVLQFGALAGRRVLRCRAKFAEYVRYSTVLVQLIQHNMTPKALFVFFVVQ